MARRDRGRNNTSSGSFLADLTGYNAAYSADHRAEITCTFFNSNIFVRIEKSQKHHEVYIHKILLSDPAKCTFCTELIWKTGKPF